MSNRENRENIRLKYGQQTEIARVLGLTPQYVREIISHYNRSLADGFQGSVSQSGINVLIKARKMMEENIKKEQEINAPLTK